MKINKLSNYRNFCNFTSGILTQNIIIFYGVAISSVIAAATNGKNALALSVAMFFTLLPTMLISSVFSKKINYVLELSIVFLVSMAGIAVSSYFIKLISPSIFESLGIYFPILATDSVIIVKSNQYRQSKKPAFAILDAITSSFGFMLVALSVGIIREYLSTGAIFEHQFETYVKLNAVKMSFAGFIILAFVCAGAKAINRLVKSIIFKFENSHS